MSKEDLVERVRDVTGGEMADVVLDMSAGSTEPVLQALDAARMGGRVVLAGLKNGKPVNGLVTDKIVAKELQVLGGFASTAGSLEIALEVLQAHRNRLRPALLALLRSRRRRPCGAYAWPRGRRRQGSRPR